MSTGNTMIDSLGALGGAFSSGVTGALDVRNKQDEVARRMRQELQELAGKRATFLQGAIDARTKSGDGRGAADLLPQFTESANTAFGTNLKAPGIAGSPIMKEQLGPPVQGAMMPRVETGRDFNNPQTLGAIRGGAMLAPSKPEPLDLMAVSPYEDVINKATGRTIRAASPKPITVDANADLERMKLQAEIQKLLREPVTDPLEAAERMARIANMNDQIRDRNAPKQPTPEKPRDPLAYEEQIQKLVTGRFPMTQAEKMSGVEDENLKYQRMVYGNKLRQKSPLNPPAPRGPGVVPPPPGLPPGAPLVPRQYTDTKLLPDVESKAQAVLSAVPGASISSRARSPERNQAAGGVANSNHKYRQAFDVIGADFQAIARAARAQGMEAIIESDHVHIQVPTGKQIRRLSPQGQAGAAFLGLK